MVIGSFKHDQIDFQNLVHNRQELDCISLAVLASCTWPSAMISAIFLCCGFPSSYSGLEQLVLNMKYIAGHVICFRVFLQHPFPSNPDLLYVVQFIHTQLTTGVTLAFLFGSKVSAPDKALLICC